MWECFSYYGMCVILMYYIYDIVVNGGLGFFKVIVLVIMFIYGLMVFMFSIIGGWVFDCVLGLRKIVFIGGLLIIVGYIVLVILFGVFVLFVFIMLIVFGIGMLKLNVLGMVGYFYLKIDLCRDVGFFIFYMGINIGVLIVFFVVGILG